MLFCLLSRLVSDTANVSELLASSREINSKKKETILLSHMELCTQRCRLQYSWPELQTLSINFLENLDKEVQFSTIIVFLISLKDFLYP